MKCESYIILLDEYLNNELEENLRSSVSAHLVRCEKCREEIRFLKAESAFYPRIDDLRKVNFTNEWETIRNLLVTESLIKTENLPEQKEVENSWQSAFLSDFFVRLEFLFFAAQKNVLGMGLLFVFGFASLFLLTDKKNSINDEETVASSEPKEISKPASINNLLRNNNSQPEKPDESDKPKFINKSSFYQKNSQKLAAIAGKEQSEFVGKEKI